MGIPDGAAESRAYTQPLDAASHANVRLQFGAGNLIISALERADGNLATAYFAGPSDYAPEPTYRIRDDVAELAYLMRDAKRGLPFFRGDERVRMDVRLTQNAPLVLKVEAGASDSMLDLSALQVSHVDLQTGVADTRMRLPQAAGQTTVVVPGGVTDLTFEVPQGVGADVRVTNALGSREIDERRFPSVGGGHYRSEKYDTAANRVDMEVNLGIATLGIQ